MDNTHAIDLKNQVIIIANHLKNVIKGHKINMKPLKSFLR